MVILLKEKCRINSFGISCANKTPLKRKRRFQPLKWNKNWNVIVERKIYIRKEAVFLTWVNVMIIFF